MHGDGILRVEGDLEDFRLLAIEQNPGIVWGCLRHVTPGTLGGRESLRRPFDDQKNGLLLPGILFVVNARRVEMDVSRLAVFL
jgi:hypothetical protein